MSTTTPAAMPARTRPDVSSFASATMRVFDLALGQMLWSRRTVFMGLVLGGPVVLALTFRAVLLVADTWLRESAHLDGLPVSGATVFGFMVWMFYVRLCVPVLAVFYGTSLIADEVEDKTLTYLFVRPIRRGAVLVGKYLAYLVCTLAVAWPSLIVVFLLVVPTQGSHLGPAFPSLAQDLAIVSLGLAAYGAVFSWVGAQMRRPLLTGLLFAFAWEPVVLVLPGYLKKATVAHYLQALVPHAMPQDGATLLLQGLFRDLPGAAVAVGSLLAIAVVGVYVAARAVNAREFVLDQ